MVDLHISWEDYNQKTEQLASMVYKDGWDFNQVVCIAKGGMRVGDIMARIFNEHVCCSHSVAYQKRNQT